MKSNLLLVLVTLGLAQTSFGAIDYVPDRLNAVQQANLKSLLQSYVQLQQMPGLVVAATSGDEVIWADGVGVSSVDSGNPVQFEHHLFRWASVSKVYTDATARYMEEMGVLGRDDSITKYYNFPVKNLTYYRRCFSAAQLQGYGTCIKNYGKAEVLTTLNNGNCFDVTDFETVTTTKNFRAVIQDQSAATGRIAFINADDNIVRCSAPYAISEQPLPANSSVISLKTILAHRAGIQHYDYLGNKAEPADNLISNADAVKNRVAAGVSHMEWAIPTFFPTHPLLNRPGFAKSYSTFGYNLAGVVIEHASSIKFHDFIKSMNVKMGSPSVQEDRLAMPPSGGFQRVQVHKRVGANLVTNAYTTDNSYKLAGGGIMSNIVDLGKFCAAAATPKYFTNAGFSGYSHSGAHDDRSLSLLGLETVGGKRQCVVLMTNANHDKIKLDNVMKAVRARLKGFGAFN